MSKCRCEKVDEKDDMRKKSMRETRWANSDQTKNLLSTCRKTKQEQKLTPQCTMCPQPLEVTPGRSISLKASS